MRILTRGPHGGSETKGRESSHSLAIIWLDVGLAQRIYYGALPNTFSQQQWDPRSKLELLHGGSSFSDLELSQIGP
jgi:hypothetical protein